MEVKIKYRLSTASIFNYNPKETTKIQRFTAIVRVGAKEMQQKPGLLTKIGAAVNHSKGPGSFKIWGVHICTPSSAKRHASKSRI